MKNKSIKTILLSLIVMALWGSLFPFIKIGYNAFGIDSSNIPSILMFAGTRFIVCGIIIFLITLLKNKLSKGTPAHFPRGKAIAEIFLIGLFTIILHYSLLYIGISITDSSKTAIIKQLGSLFYVCLAFLFFKNEKFSIWKIVGALLGFAGIIAINFSTGGVSFSYGDILIIGASFCTVVASIISKKTLEENSAFWVTGISQLFGGCVLFIVALILGADILSFDLDALFVFAYICTASTLAYILWNYILSTNSLSGMFIIKFSEPLFACVFGALLLGENIFKWQYLIAFVLISSGIILGNRNKGEK
ncbi:MAG: EamA family transporter [Clostridia bacterium]|nr:EamA family transporter [Clostridia bacterium]